MHDLISRISLKQSIVVSAILKDKKTIEQIINEEPSVDAVPVVRCKDCKHYDKGTIFPCGIAADFIVGDDDYCSSAERREEDG